MVVFLEDISLIKSLKLREKEKRLVLVIHDESIFNANDEKKKV